MLDRKNNRSIKITSLGYEILNGLLLGDGCLRNQSKGRVAYYTHADKHYQYVSWLRVLLIGLRFNLNDKINRVVSKSHGGVGYHIWTKSYLELEELRKIWYRPTKIIPFDFIDLTPITCFHWWIGDGEIKRLHGKVQRAHLCTDGFPRDQVRKLRGILADKTGMDVRNYESRNRLTILRKDLETWLSYIGKCPNEIGNSYKYKWDLSTHNCGTTEKSVVKNPNNGKHLEEGNLRRVTQGNARTTDKGVLVKDDDTVCSTDIT